MDNRAFFGLRSSAMGLLLAPLAVVACGGNDGLKKQVAGLETQITAMRADQDRLEERLAALELGGPPAAHRAPTAAAVERVERPRLKVIHLSPDDQAAPAEPAEPAPAPADAAAHRPIIRGTGDRVIKVGDGDADEPTSRDGTGTKPVAQLGKDAHGN